MKEQMMGKIHEIRQGTQIVVDGLRIGVVGAGIAEGEPAARLALRDAKSVQDVVLRVGERAATSSKAVVLLAAVEDGIAPGTGAARIEISDLTD